MKNAQFMNNGSRWISCLTVVMITAGFVAPVAAADADKEAKREVRRLQAQLAAGQKEKTLLSAQVDDLKKQISDFGEKSAGLEKKSGGQRKQLTELTEKYQEADKNLQQMTQQFSETSKTLQQLEKEKEQEQKRLSGEIQVCEKKNTQLYQISVELMEKYKAKGVFAALLEAEPFTRLGKVKMEIMMQDYKDKTDSAKIVTTREHVTIAVTTPSIAAQEAPRP